MASFIAILSWAIALYQAWSIGANDETTAPVVSGRTMTTNQAVLIGSIFGTLDAVFLDLNVQKIIGISFLNEPPMECASLFGRS